MQHITGIPPEGLTAEEIEKMRKKFGVSFKFSKFVLDDKLGVRRGARSPGREGGAGGPSTRGGAGGPGTRGGARCIQVRVEHAAS